MNLLSLCFYCSHCICKFYSRLHHSMPLGCSACVHLQPFTPNPASTSMAAPGSPAVFAQSTAQQSQEGQWLHSELLRPRQQSKAIPRQNRANSEGRRASHLSDHLSSSAASSLPAQLLLILGVSLRARSSSTANLITADLRAAALQLFPI